MRRGRLVKIYNGQRMDPRQLLTDLRDAARAVAAPPLSAFTPAERRSSRGCSDAARGAAFLNRLPYNTEPPPGRATLRSFRGVVRHGTAHCLEAALSAAVILEQHGFPPLVLSFESIDELDHVLFVYQQRGRWGSVARSRDPGLHGRKPVFATPRALALSYVDPYVDFTGRVTGYAVVDLRVMGGYDWRLSDRERVEGRAHAAGRAAPTDPVVGRADRSPPASLQGVLQGNTNASRVLLPRARAVDGNSRRGIGKASRVRPAHGLHIPMPDHQSRSKSRVGLVIGSSRA